MVYDAEDVRDVIVNSYEDACAYLTSVMIGVISGILIGVVIPLNYCEVMRVHEVPSSD